MIWINLEYREESKQIIYYHRGDLNEEDIIPEIRYAKVSDIGKYAMLDDGSELYVQILGCTNAVIRTNAGTYRRWDLVFCSIPKIPEMSYSGINIQDMHPYVRGYTQAEKNTANALIKDPKRKLHITKRIRMLTLEKIQERAREQGMTENQLIDNVIEAAQKPNGLNFKWAMTIMMAAHGFDPNDFIYSHMKKELPIQETRRITNLKNGNTLTEVTTVIPYKRDFAKALGGE